MNIMLAASAFNFKRMMNKWKSSFCQIFKSSLERILKLFFLNINLNPTF